MKAEVLILLALTSATASCAQSCLPRSYGAQLPSGATACIQPTGANPYGPVPPILYFTGSGGSCDSNSGTLTTNYTEVDSRAQPYTHSTAGVFSTSTVSGGTIAYVDWSTNVYSNPYDPGFYEGGNAILSTVLDGNPYTTTPFTIAGVNPSLPVVTQAMEAYGPPWYYGRLLTQESSNRQFYGSQYAYTPIYGYPDGFGIAQLDGTSPFGTATTTSGQTDIIPKLTDSVFWNWYLNVAEGMGYAYSVQQKAYDWFTSQNQQAAAAGVPPPIEAGVYGTCQPMLWNGTGETGMQDAEWITVYNGGHAVTYYSGQNGTAGQWSLTTSYVTAVCNANSQTISNG